MPKYLFKSFSGSQVPVPEVARIGAGTVSSAGTRVTYTPSAEEISDGITLQSLLSIPGGTGLRFPYLYNSFDGEIREISLIASENIMYLKNALTSDLTNDDLMCFERYSHSRVEINSATGVEILFAEDVTGAPRRLLDSAQTILKHGRGLPPMTIKGGDGTVSMS